jgi:hypothetical protein
MSKWSSYKKDQLIMESWKNFLNEAVVGDFQATGGRSLRKSSVPGLTKDQYSERVFGADGVKVLNLIPTATELIKPYNADKELQKLADSIEKLNDNYEEYSRITGNMLNSDPSDQVRTLLGLKKHIPEAAKKGESKPLEDALKKVSGLVVDSFPDSQSLIDKLEYNQGQADRANIENLNDRRVAFRNKAYREISQPLKDRTKQFIRRFGGFSRQFDFVDKFTSEPFTDSEIYKFIKVHNMSDDIDQNYMGAYGLGMLWRYYIRIEATIPDDVRQKIKDNFQTLANLNYKGM